jgi:hypothetical protein
LTKDIHFFENFRDVFLLIIIIEIATIGILTTVVYDAPTNFTPALISVNLIFVIFYFIQWRNTTRPILSIELKGAEDDIFCPNEKAEPRVRETCDSGAFINISNISNNIATSITLDFSFDFQDIHFLKSHTLPYLNPNETGRIEVPFGIFYETYPDLFTGDKALGIVLKKTLEIELDVSITYGTFPRYSMKDSYHVKWGGLDGSREDLEGITSWNERGDWWIYKRKKA